jgi:hypothetical protein
MNRKREQAELFFLLGQLFGPLLKMIENHESYDSEERTRIVARFNVDADAFGMAFQKYTSGEPGHYYRQHWHEVNNYLAQMYGYRGKFEGNDFSIIAKKSHQGLFDCIYSIPVPIESAVHEAHSPFSTYCLVRDLCSTSIQRVVWMDRYFDLTLFARYFVDTPPATHITLITYPESKCQNPNDRQRYADFLGVSKIFALERGTAGYRLLVDEQFHDRWLQCDSKMFTLGGSIKELGKASTFTITKLDTTPENQKAFDEAQTRAMEIFGPSQTTHP